MSVGELDETIVGDDRLAAVDLQHQSTQPVGLGAEDRILDRRGHDVVDQARHLEDLDEARVGRGDVVLGAHRRRRQREDDQHDRHHHANEAHHGPTGSGTAGHCHYPVH